MRKKNCVTIILILTLINFSFAVEVKSFKMTTNSVNISMGDVVSVMAELSTNGAVSLDIPQFPQSSDYSVLGANKSQSSSTSISIVNGKTTTDKTINMRFLYQIRFNANKSVNLPPLSIYIDGKQITSNAITFNIGEKPFEESPVSVKFIRERSTIYKGEQAKLTVRVQLRANTSAQLTNDGYVGFLNTLQDKLSGKFTVTPLSNSPQTKQEAINGIPHTTYDLSFNLVPVDTGKISIQPIPVSYIIEERSGGRDPFDGFFGFSSVRQKQAATLSPVLSYSINDIPKPMPKNYKGIIGEIKLTGNLSSDSVSAGEAITLKVVISGKMSSALMGEIELDKNPDLDIFPPERKITQDTSANGITTKKQYSWMIVPKKEGVFNIPVKEIVWFDPNSATFKTASAGSFKIKASAGNYEQKIQAKRYLTQSEIAALGEDIRYIKTEFSANDSKEFDKKTTFRLFLSSWILALILILIKLKMIFFPKNHKAQKQSKAFSVAIRELNGIHKGKEKNISEISAVIKYLSTKTAKECGSMKYEEIENLLKSRKVGEETCKKLTDYFREVEILRYASNSMQKNPAKNGVEILKRIEREFR